MKYLIKSKTILLLFTIFSTALCSCGTTNINVKNKYENELLTASDDVNVYQLASFLMNKKEHYPISDEFIEKYQQNGGGYIDYAESLGMEVNRLKHLPDQKFHFFDSWYIRSIQDNSLSYTDSAKSRVYVGIKCPELLLWIFEACNASPSKVRNAMKVAENGKISKEHISTTAKKMREAVLWEDLHIDTSFKMCNAVSFSNSPYQVRMGEELQIKATSDPIDTSDIPTWSISKGSDLIDITSDGDKCNITAKKTGTAEISVAYNKFATAKATINVLEASKPMIIGVPELIDLDINGEYSLNPKLNMGEANFTYSNYDESVISINEEGVIKALAHGTSDITIKSNELTKTIKVDCFNHGKDTAPLNVKQANDIANKYCKNNESSMISPLYIKGTITNLNENKTSFLLKDNEATLAINNVTSDVDISNNDQVTLSGILSNKNNQFIINNSNVINVCKGESNIKFILDGNCDVFNNDIKITDVIKVKNGSEFIFKAVANNNRVIKEILVNNKELAINKDNIYKVNIDGDMAIKITTYDPNSPEKYTYDITYDLGTRKTAKLIESSDILFSTFTTTDQDSIINSVTELSYIYGGGNGGRGETKWTMGNMLKLGTTSVIGSFTLNLKQKVNKIIIKGYATDTRCSIRVGDAASTDWNDVLDNKTVICRCGTFNLSTKSNVEAGLTSSVEISFPATCNLKISTTVSEPIYITGIEFYVEG